MPPSPPQRRRQRRAPEQTTTVGAGGAKGRRGDTVRSGLTMWEAEGRRGKPPRTRRRLNWALRV
jgi:hypothetical protein